MLGKFRSRRQQHHGGNDVVLLTVAFALGLVAIPAANADDTDPPTRVGRIALIQGTVSFHPSPDDQWQPAQLNGPVAQSTAIWADTDGVAEVGLGEARIRLAGGTELDIVQLDDQNVILSVPQGRVDIALHGATDGERYDIQTPRGDVDLLGDGDYRVIAGTDSDPTRVASFTGHAELVGASSSITVAANQEMVATPGAQVGYSIASATQDGFDKNFFEAVAMVHARPVPAYVPVVPGIEELSQYGSWRDDPQYGHVWVPTRVEPGWQPYRHGHWAFVPPWGYTWIDDAPWGFAPFHYGRWVRSGNSWAWVPVERGVSITPGFRPVYAPAMVSFIGNPAALTVGVAGASASVGWVPLGPGEPWRPWYPHSENYVRQANIVNVNRTVITNITNTTIINQTFVNQRAAVVVPQAAFAASRPVAQVAYGIPPAALARPIEQARPAQIEKVLPPPVVRVAEQKVVLPPAPQLQMAHPAAASAATFHAQSPPPPTAPQSAIPKAGSNVVPKGTVIPPAAKPLAAHPAVEEVKPGGPEAQKPIAGQPATAGSGTVTQHPAAAVPGESKPGAGGPRTVEQTKPATAGSGVAQQPGVAVPGESKPGAGGPRTVEQTKPATGGSGVATPHVGAGGPGEARPGAGGPHAMEQPKPETNKPGPASPPTGAASSGAAPTGAATPHPAEALKPRPATPPETGHPPAQTPSAHQQTEAPKPINRPVEQPKTGAASPVEPGHPAAERPVPHPQAEAPKREPRQAEEQKPASHAAEPPRPAAAQVEPRKPAPQPTAAEPSGHKPSEATSKQDEKKTQ